MAVSPLRTLLTARIQFLWNASLRQTGALGLAGSSVALLVSAVVLVGPGSFSVMAGMAAGRDLVRPGGSLIPVSQMGGLYTAVVIAFGVLSGLRHQKRFPWKHLRHFPVPAMQALLVEMLAGIFEVMPMVGIVCLVGFGAGLSMTLPGGFPIILLLTASAVAGVGLAQMIVGGAKRILINRVGTAAAVAGLIALVLFLSWWLIRMDAGSDSATGQEAILWGLPATQSLLGLQQFLYGRTAAGWLLQFSLVLGVALLFILAVWVDRYEAAMSTGEPRKRGARPLQWSSRGSAASIGRLFQMQVLSSSYGQVLMFLPLLYSVIVLVTLRVPSASRSDSPGGWIQAAEGLPWTGIFLVAVPLLGHDLWMNQFGWDGAGIRALFILPIEERSILLGKLMGLTRILGLQALVGILPILYIDQPDLWQGLGAIAAGGFALLAVAGMGHMASLLAPRKLEDKDAGKKGIPLSLSIVPATVVIALVAVLILTYRLAGEVHPLAPPAAMMGLLVLGTVVYVVSLPFMAERLAACRERLLSSLS